MGNRTAHRTGASKRNPLKQLADELGIQRVVTLDEERLIDANGAELDSQAEAEVEAQVTGTA